MKSRTRSSGANRAASSFQLNTTRARHDDERGRARFAVGAQPRSSQRQDHDGLAQPHVVGEASAEAEPAQEREPAERLALIVAQLPGERRRGVERRDAAERLQLVARAGERFVDLDRGLRRERRVEQRRPATA